MDQQPPERPADLGSDVRVDLVHRQQQRSVTRHRHGSRVLRNGDECLGLSESPALRVLLRPFAVLI